MAKPNIEHKDKFGIALAVGDHVIYADTNDLMIGTVVKIHPKLIGVQPIKARSQWFKNKYSSNLIRVDGPALTWYILNLPT